MYALWIKFSLGLTMLPVITARWFYRGQWLPILGTFVRAERRHKSRKDGYLPKTDDLSRKAVGSNLGAGKGFFLVKSSLMAIRTSSCCRIIKHLVDEKGFSCFVCIYVTCVPCFRMMVLKKICKMSIAVLNL